MTDNETTITVRLPKTLKDAITAAAKSQDLTASQYIRRFIAANTKPARKGSRAQGMRKDMGGSAK